jgi:hypothetical protein
MERARNRAKQCYFMYRIYNRENAMKLSVLMMMVSVVACAASSRTAPAEPWQFEVTSSGGIAGRGAGNYSISSDGTVVVTTMTRTTCRYTATGEDLSRFRTLLANARPQTWKESYIPENACCDRFEYQLTVTEAGQTPRTVKWIDDPEPMPKDLAAITAAMVGPEPSVRTTYGGKCR